VKRRLFNIAALVSLVIGLALSALWARSHQRSHVAGCGWGVVFGGSSTAGRLGIAVQWRDPPDWERRGVWISSPVTDPDLATLRAIAPRGFAAWHRFDPVPGGTQEQYEVVIPHALAVALLLLVPAAWLGVRWRRDGGRSDRCPACGYDLRGSEGAACPECGGSDPGKRS
jgi:hypothetical protein